MRISLLLRAVGLFGLVQALWLTPTSGVALATQHPLGPAQFGAAMQRADGAVIVPLWQDGRGAMWRLQHGTLRRWSSAAIDATTAPVSSPDGIVFVGCSDGRLRALALDGSELWQFAADGARLGTPAVTADGSLYVGDAAGKLHALRPDGTLRWRHAMEDWITAAPVIGGDGTIYVGAWDGTFQALTAAARSAGPRRSAGVSKRRRPLAALVWFTSAPMPARSSRSGVRTAWCCGGMTPAESYGRVR